MNRFKASGIHFLISVIIVSILLTVMFALWYPNSYFSLMGGGKLISLIAGVDVFLGPLLTLIVFNPLKKSLKFDLACIAMLQIIAMSYGMYVMFEARPVFTVFNKDHFHVVSVVDIHPEELVKGKKDKWRTLSLTGPVLAAIRTPDKNDKVETAFAMVEAGHAYRYPRLYDDYEAHKSEVIKAASPLKDLAVDDKKSAINDFLLDQNRPISDFGYLPIKSEVSEASAIIDVTTGNLIKIIN
jgi:hypothetical protein